MNINIKRQIMDSMISEYNTDPSKKELEFILKKEINENSLNNILKFLNKTKKKLEVIYILDIDISSISNNHRLSLKTDSNNILKQHCLNEKNNNFSDYVLEYKKLINRHDISDYNIRLNLKDEYEETDTNIKSQFNLHYSKFVKNYRFKKRYIYKFDDFNIDISIVKTNKGRNIISSNLSDTLETYEIEVECASQIITFNTILSIIKYLTYFIQISNNSYFINSNSFYDNILANYKKLLLKFNYKDIGPKPITLTKKTIPNMILSDTKLSNISTTDSNQLYYKITVKADGDRYFMYIDNDLKIFLLNDNNNIIQTGLQLSLDNIEFKNSILDGEYLSYKNSKNIHIYEYKFFDIYIVNSNITYNTILENRIKLMTKLDNILTSKAINYLNKDIFIKCSQKPYYPLEEFNNIMLNTDSREYGFDGIIFMPINSLSNINNRAYKDILKYKPANFNSIDVFIKDETLHCASNIQYNSSKIYILSEIHSFKPYIFNIHKPDAIYNSNLEPLSWNTLNNKIVEIRYDQTSSKFIFMNIRYDKTIKYNKNKEANAANNIDIVQDIISNTFNPFHETFFEQLNIDSIKSISKLASYYDNTSLNKRNDLRKINNLIKKELIDNSIQILETIQSYNSDFSYIKVLDLACGRGGDIFKFINTNFDSTNILKKNGGIQFILGIDSDPNNIEHYDDKEFKNNSRARFLQYKNQFLQDNLSDNIPDIYNNNSAYFISGDINNFDGDDDTIEEIFDTLMDIDNNDFPQRNKFDKKLINDINDNYPSINLYKKHSFELINCQFAIHYFNLKYFSKLVDTFLKPNGIFICTFMEKQFVLDLLGENEVVSGEFWSIKKSTNPNKILVKFETLDSDYLEENLISKNDIISAFAKHSIKPYRDKLTQQISNRRYIIPSTFDFKNHNKLKFSKNPELNFSKLYSYIIFEKSPPQQNIISGIQELQQK